MDLTTKQWKSHLIKSNSNCPNFPTLTTIEAKVMHGPENSLPATVVDMLVL